MSAEKRLKQLGIVLDPVTPPVANYVNAVRSGKLLFLSGKGPSAVAGVRPRGKLGREFSVEQGYAFARSVGLALLAVIKSELGSLDRVTRVVKLLGMVNAEPDFTDQPQVINGCSDLFVEVFGACGRHARSAVGMGSLPMGIPVEIEAIVEVAAPARRPARKAQAKRGAKTRAAKARRG